MLDWRLRLRREGIAVSLPDADTVLHVSLRPAAPAEWIVPDMAGLTFRLGNRADGAPVCATALYPPGVVRIGRRFGLDEASSFAFVDSHERMHVQLQLEGVAWEDEEQLAWIVDAAYLSLEDPLAERLFAERGLPHVTGGGFFEELLAGREASERRRNGEQGS